MGEVWLQARKKNLIKANSGLNLQNQVILFNRRWPLFLKMFGPHTERQKRSTHIDTDRDTFVVTFVFSISVHAFLTFSGILQTFFM